ncbi:MAG TPA: ATP-binding protein, partial [Candidatus Dormibacteraeota bacterium]|nr:ATP-binding protein [Candidatus Dormibacteraeota bacterium]
IRYYGPPLTVPHTSYQQVFETNGAPDELFRDKVVFVGAKPMVQSFHGRQDEFRNPFHSWANKDLFMPGVEVHATELLNLMNGDLLRRLSAGQERLLLVLVAALFGGGLLWLRPIPATVSAAAGVLCVVVFTRAAFAYHIWFPWLIAAAVQIPTALGGSVLYYSVEWYRMRRRLEAARRTAEEKIREQAALIDKAHDAIVVQDLNGGILYANSRAERLYGWSLNELQQDGSARELFSPDAEAAAAARAAAQSSGEWNGELRLQTRVGEVLTMDTRWTLIREEDGRPKALLLINSDITEKKQLEAQFLRTQRMNTIGSLAGGMAHDLNNALAPILMGVQLLRRKLTDEESKNLLSMMESNTHRSAEMVRQVLLFARGRAGELERLDVAPLVKELEKVVRETFPKNITVEDYLPADLWHVVGNPTQLHQVLLNLCVNARDAMPQGGRLSFAADNVQLSAEDAAQIPEGKPGEYVSLLVSDTGTGMPAEVRARMFEPFFTTKGEGQGTGIGLSTVLRIVKSHNGFLRVESEPGQGTTFEVFLPRAENTAAIRVETPLADAPRGNGELILVADDERAIRELVRDGLTTHGYRVLTASTGEEALKIFAERRNEVALLFTDNAMPVMDGSQAITEIRKMRADLPVILASGQSHIENGHSHGSLLLLRKPFSLDEILASVHRLLPSTKQEKSKEFLGK